MSYYNTQTNPQQNPQSQAQTPYNRQVSQQARGNNQSFNNWMAGANKPAKPQMFTQTDRKKVTPQQPQQNGQGWQPRSPVNANGTINPNPISFNVGYQPAPKVETQKTTTGPDPYAQLRQQQNAETPVIPQEYMPIAQLYKQYLGRPGSLPEWQNWASNPNAQVGISTSPEAEAYKQFQQNPQNQPQQPNPFGNLAQYNPMQVPDFLAQTMGQYGNINTPGMYDVTRPEAYNYGGQLAEGLNPFSGATQQAFNQLAGMPLGLPVEQLKSQQNEVANEMFNQNAASAMQRAAASGTVNGGMAERLRQQMMNERNQSILGAHRDIDIENAYALRDNAAKVADLGNNLANSYSSRLGADEGFIQAAADSNQNADINFQQFLAQQYGDAMDGSNFELDRTNAVADRGQGIWDTLNSNYFDGRQQNLQDFLGTEGMRLDRDQFSETQGQNKFGNIMDLLGFMEGQRQFNKGYGLDNRRLGMEDRNSQLANALKRRDQDINLLSFFGDY